ncbi:MAG: sulfite exporter TauE/SafE family protein [Candidatus Heimdallarchaeota archaeon]
MILPLGLTWSIAAILVLIAFLCEFMDSSLGMGYGTTLTPVLLLFGFEVSQIVPAVLISEFVTGLSSAIFHILFKNMTLGSAKKSQTEKLGIKSPDARPAGSGVIASTKGFTDVKPKFRQRLRNLTLDTKVVIILTFFGVLGTIVAAVISVVFGFSSVFKFGAKIYIGLMVFSMGIIIVTLINKDIKFSLKRIISLGAIAGFNKGISGGGYGPITVSGQILSGREGKNAIASTSLAEGIVCFVGALAYILTNIITSYKSTGIVSIGELGLAPILLIGAFISAPLAALTTKKIDGKWLKIAVGIATILLGLFSLTRSILGFLNIW